MLYIFSALYPEAKPVIRHFQLKKEQGLHRFPQFCGDGIRLTLTGMGNAAASTAVGSVLTADPPASQDILLNLGTCYGRNVGAIYLCNKITELSSGRAFYPDMLIPGPFPEVSIATANRLVKEGEELADMEAAAVFQAGNFFLGPDRMIFLKVVSDSGKLVTPAKVEQLMGQHEILNYTATLRDIAAEEPRSALNEEQTGLLSKLVEDLHCSATMEHSLTQYVTYLALAGIPWEESVQAMYREGRLPCRDRQEGKVRFEELKQNWI